MGKIVIGTLIFVSLMLSGCSGATGIQHSVSDETAFNGAIELKDPSFCEKIRESDYRAECIKEVQDEKNNDRALEENDPSLCELMSTRDKRNACNIQLQIHEAETQEQKTKIDEIEQANQIVASGKYEQCAVLSDKNLRTGCETNIIYDRAVKENNYSLCDKITDALHRQSCHELEQMNNPAN